MIYYSRFYRAGSASLVNPWIGFDPISLNGHRHSSIRAHSLQASMSYAAFLRGPSSVQFNSLPIWNKTLRLQTAVKCNRARFIQVNTHWTKICCMVGLRDTLIVIPSLSPARQLGLDFLLRANVISTVWRQKSTQRLPAFQFHLLQFNSRSR